MKKTGLTWQRTLPYVLLVAAAVGLCASFALTYDKIHILQNPAYQPGCNLNPVLSCASVMKTSQASLLGVPNTVFGLIAFSMLAMFGLALAGGAVYKRWLWLAAQGAATLGFIFVHYLFFEAIFRIHAICPWCFTVWMVVMPVFLGITIYNIRAQNFGVPRSAKLKHIFSFISTHSNDLLLLWYLSIFAILLLKFWYYWKTLL